MTLDCRLCGLEKTERELVVTLQSETENVSFMELIQYFCRIELDQDPSLSQNVCKTCKVSLESFMLFCDHLERHQQLLKQKLNSKKENKVDDVVAAQVSEQTAETVPEEHQLPPNIDSSLARDLVTGLSDENIDSPMSTNQTDDTISIVNGYSESTTSTSDSTSYFNRRRKLIPEILNCSVALEILDLEYVRSDTDSETESDEEVVKEIKTCKRPRNSSESSDVNFSLPKRMRFIEDFKLKIEPKADDDEDLNSISSARTPLSEINFTSYYKLFEAELKLSYNESNYNLAIPLAAKAVDGSIVEDYAQQFFPWSSIELKCLKNNCDVKKLSPYELSLHREQLHPNQKEQFIKCSLCPASSSSSPFNFTSYVQHVTEDHYSHLSYCCLICSKMFYNFTALFHHYQTFHPIFTASHICVYEGKIFEDFSSLKTHVESHETMKPKFLKIEKVESAGDVTEKPEKNLTNGITKGKTKGYNCDICGHKFRSIFNFESHKETHVEQIDSDDKFSSNYSLINHEIEARQDNNFNFEA